MTNPSPTPLALTLARGSRDTLPVQLARQIRDHVSHGLLDPGQRLPSSRSLAADLGVARAVVEAAFDQLVAEGWLVTRTGAGTFVGDVGGPKARARPGASSGSRVDRSADRVSFDTGTPYVDPRLDGGWRRAWREVAHATMPRGYPDPAGIAELREHLAAYVARRRGVACTADEVLVTSGTTHGLALVLELLGRGTVAIEDPGYRAAVEVARSARFDVVDIPVDGEGICVAALAACPGGVRAVYVTPAHQHPTGVTMSASRRVALVAEAERRRALIIEDDYDSEFRYDVAPLPALASLSPDVIYLGTAAKAVHPALRIGWLVGSRDLVAELADRRARRHDHSSWPVQRAFLAMLRDGHVDRLIRSARRVYAERSELVRERLAPYAPVHGAGAGMYVTVPLPGSLARSVAAAARGADLDVPLLSAYGRTDRRDGIVLGFGGVTQQELDRCLDVVTAVLATGRGVA
ncbi:MAG: PLP-dependent aminotransferase family protein [Nocardioidaceae bacterium]